MSSKAGSSGTSKYFVFGLFFLWYLNSDMECFCFLCMAEHLGSEHTANLFSPNI